MMIDVYIADQFFNRWVIQDLKYFVFDGSNIEDPEEYNSAFEQYVESKESLVRMAKAHFMEHTTPLLKTMKSVSVHVVFESKMNEPAEEFEL